MAGVVALLARAGAEGLTVALEGTQVVIRGPKRLAPLAQEVLTHKAEVLELLRRERPTCHGGAEASLPGGLVTVATYAATMERFAKADGYVVDLETTGLGTYESDRLCGVAIADAAGGPPSYFPFR